MMRPHSGDICEKKVHKIDKVYLVVVNHLSFFFKNDFNKSSSSSTTSSQISEQMSLLSEDISDDNIETSEFPVEYYGDVIGLPTITLTVDSIT